MTIKFNYIKAIIIVTITIIILSTMQTKCFATKDEDSKIIKYTHIYTYDDEIFVWKDPETDVQYIVYKGYRKGGITPRLNNDGTLYIAQD